MPLIWMEMACVVSNSIGSSGSINREIFIIPTMNDKLDANIDMLGICIRIAIAIDVH